MITPIYAAALALLLITLSARVIAYRRANQLGLGDHGDKGLLKRMRAQANCAEYVPMGVVLIALVELQNGGTFWVHAIGLLLLAGRIAHGVGFSARPPIMQLRITGMMLTFASYILAILCIFILTVSGA